MNDKNPLEMLMNTVLVARLEQAEQLLQSVPHPRVSLALAMLSLFQYTLLSDEADYNLARLHNLMLEFMVTLEPDQTAELQARMVDLDVLFPQHARVPEAFQSAVNDVIPDDWTGQVPPEG